MKGHSDTPPEHALARYAAGLALSDLTRHEREYVAMIVVDSIGVAVGAWLAGHDSGRIAEDHALSCGGVADSRLWSGQGHLPADRAALCNGTWAEVLDFQDVVVDPRNNGHAAVTIVPAALAVAEREGATGKDLIAAVAAGLEVTLAILRAVGRRHRSDGRGFRTTSIAAPVGGAVACGKLLGLDEAGLLNAMGLAGACAPNGLMPSLATSNGGFGMDKDWVNGLAAQLAVNSADLARAGMTASDRVVTGEKGLAASHAHGDAAPLVSPEGGAPGLPAIALKRHAACYGVHSAMEAALDLRARHGIDPASIDRIVVRVKADSAETLGGRVILNHMAARFSLPYSVASALVRGSQSSIRDFEEPAIRDSVVLGLLERLEVLPDPDLTRFHEETGGFPALVEVTVGEETHLMRVDYPSGSFQRPMTWSDLVAKLSELAPGRWTGSSAATVVEAARALPEGGTVRTLLDACLGP